MIAAMTRITAISAASFVASIGVNAAIDYTDGKYANIHAVLADLNYIGISLIRTASYFSTMSGQAAYNLAASDGIRFDMLLYTSDALPATMTQLAGFATAHPGAIVSIEGPNEINNFGASYDGMTGAPAAIAYQDALYGDVAANAVLQGTTVYSYTMNAGAVSSTGYDDAVIHPYAIDGEPPLWFLNHNIASFPAGKPFVVTEAGYSTLSSQSGGVDATVQAIYDLDTIFDAKAAGAASVFLYELLDAYPDTANNLVGNHYGMFDYANNPKMIAVALHDLTTILGGGPASYSPGVLALSISGADSTAHAMLLQKATSVFDLVIWDEQTIWDNTAHTEMAPVVHTEAIRFARLMETVDVYDPLLGTAPIAVYHDVGSISLAVGADPLIVETTPVPIETPAIIGARAGSKTIEATASGMLIIGAAGDTIDAVGNTDTFVFHAGFGKETINGFAPGAASGDVIQFDKTLFASFAALEGAMHQSGDTVVISYDAHDQLVLDHVSMSQLSSANFLFV
jgi:hypothetical protein